MLSIFFLLLFPVILLISLTFYITYIYGIQIGDVVRENALTAVVGCVDLFSLQLLANYLYGGSSGLACRDIGKGCRLPLKY